MEDKVFEIKAAVSAFFAIVGTFLGWKGIMLLIWVAAMVLDYISGSLAAHKNGEWSSAKAREGLHHKGGTILVVLVAMLFDGCLALIAINIPALNITSWPGVIFPVVLAWYIITELGSILENSVSMGAAYPEWLMRGLKIAGETIAKTGQNAVDQMEQEADNGQTDS